MATKKCCRCSARTKSPTKSSIAWRSCYVPDPREQLRRYLEQRRELGERELVLDGLSVEDALRIVGAASARPAAHTADPRPVRQEEPAAAPDDWRAALRAAGAAPETK